MNRGFTGHYPSKKKEWEEYTFFPLCKFRRRMKCLSFHNPGLLSHRTNDSHFGFSLFRSSERRESFIDILISSARLNFQVRSVRILRKGGKGSSVGSGSFNCDFIHGALFLALIYFVRREWPREKSFVFEGDYGKSKCRRGFGEGKPFVEKEHFIGCGTLLYIRTLRRRGPLPWGPRGPLRGRTFTRKEEKSNIRRRGKVFGKPARNFQTRSAMRN
ncbi:hypothetical protein NPIL_73131 [Nephila pilipes]|uniref:Uncharacterized protein n=1 Tax=Nephila pilipes TaxID=299642 RepID=A0A8X6MRI6_NEPPI|nr:hypothetical protein NPIL_73131 [Nephila pilipes]